MALLLILPTLSHTLPNTFPNPSSSPHPLLPHNLITIYFTGYAVWSKTPNVTQHTPLSQFRIRNHLRLNRMLPGIYYSLNLNISKNWPISYYKVSPPQIPYQEMNQCYRTSENISIPPRTHHKSIRTARKIRPVWDVARRGRILTTCSNLYKIIRWIDNESRWHFIPGWFLSLINLCHQLSRYPRMLLHLRIDEHKSRWSTGVR